MYVCVCLCVCVCVHVRKCICIRGMVCLSICATDIYCVGSLIAASCANGQVNQNVSSYM
jgi:hypothetical protein